MQGLSSFFLISASPEQLLIGEYRPWLVALSVLVAVLTSAMALQLAGVARRAASAFYRQLAIATGALALGGGVWSMHFIGMLAFAICAEVVYDPALTLLSVLPSLAASWVALNLLARKQVSHRQLLLGGSLVGAGIGTMHYAGMAAMSMAPLLRYDPWLFGLSLLVAVALATGALWIRFGLRGRVPGHLALLLGSLVMGSAISGMHYVGMAGARFVGLAESATPLPVYGSAYLALAVAMATLSFSVLVAAANGLLRYRQLATELEEGRLHLDSLLDAAREVILTVDHQGIVRSANRSAQRLYGWPPDELVGQHMSVLMNEQHRETFGQALQNYMRSGRPQLSGIELELNGRARDGREIPVRVSLGVSHREGKPWFVVFVADIAERKAMEQALRESEQQYRSLIGNIPGVSFRCLLDADWSMLFISDAVEQLTGWKPADFTERRCSFADLYHPDDLARVAEDVQRAIAERRNYQVEYRIRDRQGREHWIWESGSAVCDENGVPHWIDGVLLDQTDSKLRNAEYESKVNAISRAMVMVEFDMQGRILALNDNFIELFGYQREVLLGQHHSLLCAPEEVAGSDHQRFWDDLRQGLFRAGECQRFAHDGREIWVQASYNPILDADGKPFKVLKLATDLTPRRMMEQELRAARDRAEQAAAARSSFLANMSHEIRTPMNAIIGFTDLLLDAAAEPTQRHQLSIVQQSSRSLLRLLNDILDTAKLDRGAIELETLDFSLRELCRQVCDALRLGAEQKGLVLEMGFTERVGDIYRGDPLRLRQVLTNLLGNAIKFTEQGRVGLQVSGEPGALRLIVSDTGIGIAEDRLEKIFDPFAQADASMSRRFGGTGLGTTISRQLVELMGGRIQVRSRLGEGSEFIVELPLAAGSAVTGAEPGLAPVATPGLPPLRILAADDVAQNLELLALNLEPLGHRLVKVSDGAAATEMFARETFDLVLMDVQMPGTDGLEACRRIRALEAAEQRKAVPVIALTASVLDRDRQAALDAGMNGFASKPLEMPALLGEMARLLGLEQAPAQATGAAGAGSLFDWRGGGRRWGSPLRMADAVKRFLDDEAGLATALLSALHAAEWQQVQQQAHRLRGAAANLGLRQLALLGEALECAASAQDNRRVEQLCAELQRTLTAIAVAVPLAPVSVQPPARPLDLPSLREACAQLQLQLRRGALDDAAVACLEQALVDRQPDALDRLRSALQGFDFDLAQQAVADLQAWLNNPSEERAE